jgi:AcrR family transcriptional regulator
MHHQLSKSRENVREQIAKATLRLVSERGVDGVSTVDVAKALRMDRATMAKRCPQEGDLWRIATEFIEGRLQEWWRSTASADMSASERLRSLVWVQIGLIMGMPPLRELVFSQGFNRTNPALQKGLFRVRARFAELLRGILMMASNPGSFRRTSTRSEPRDGSSRCCRVW